MREQQKLSRVMSCGKGAVSYASLLLLLLSFGLLLSPAHVSAEIIWQNVAGQVDIVSSNPLRSRRSPDATVDVEVTNTGASSLNSPLRLVLGDLTPATVSLKNASGFTETGEPYLDMTAFIGDTMAAGASSGPMTLTIAEGGSTNFTFTPRVEQGVDTGPEPVELTVQITSPATLLTVGSTPLAVSGTISDPDASLTLNGVPVSHSNGEFQGLVALEEGLNTIVARAVKAGSEGTDSIVVSMDLTPPYITVDNPVDGAVVNTDVITVTGLVNDIVRGTISEGEANVTVNGVTATVSNRSYMARNVKLAEGDNTLTISAADAVGNVSQLSINVHYKVPAPRRIEMVSGQDQSASIGTPLTQPLTVRLVDSDGSLVPGKDVVFRVVQGEGTVGAGTLDESQAVLVTSDADGLAATSFKVGARAGNGNHRVRARALGFDGEVVFNASATAALGDKVSIISGNNQRGAVNQPLPQPFIVAVTDVGNNLIAGAEVEFAVVKGGGKFHNGAQTFVATTDADGRATAELTLGPEVGLDVQTVRASLVGTPAIAGFTASALVVGDPGQTSISGVVLDNQDNPIPGVTIRVDGTAREAIASAEGQFTITEVPVGPVHLIVDGSTATIPGEWPTLSYNIVTIAGAENPLSSPIYLVKLDTEHAKWVGAEDVEYTLEELPGFKLTVKAGSVTFPDGSKQGLLSVTPVNANKVPMAPPNGMQPQLIVTIQPAGAKFDPPAPLTLPNVDGHKPGAQVEMYSYDHDLEEFVTIGLGTVSADGSVIASNNGVGVIKAGWHCGSQPAGSGCCSGGGGGGGCAVCQKSESDDCNNNDCVADDSQDPGECQKCSGGAPVPDDSEDPGECKSCKGGKVENDPDGASCDDGLYCTSADGESPGPDQCENGSCKGKNIERKKTSEHIIEADFAKMVSVARKGFADLMSVSKSAGIKPYFSVKTQAKKINVTECCEADKKVVESSGVEGNGLIEAGAEVKSPDFRIPYALGLVTVTFGGKVIGRGKLFRQVYEKACSDEGKCYEKEGAQLSGFLEGSITLGLISPKLISATGQARYTGSYSWTAECGPTVGGGCAGPLSLRGQVKAISFVSYTFSYIVPGTQGCTQSD